MPEWPLIDAEARNALYPDSFDLLTLAERGTLDPGDQARIGFSGFVDGSVPGERFWVTVIRRRSRAYLGRIEAPLAGPWNQAHPPGSLVAFEAKHVIDVVYTDAD